MKRNWKQKLLLAGAFALVGGKAMAQTNDVTTIYSGVSTHFNASVAICIGAIAIGAAIMYIRKGLKARA